MSDAPSDLTCLVTIHGIGFQQFPVDGIPGYADGLHERLNQCVDPTVLNDDPNRERSRPGQAGPIYVSSNWPPNTENVERGLERLGSWSSTTARSVDGTRAPLATHPGICHVALVYSRLEDTGPQPEAFIESSARVAVSLGQYATVRGAVQMFLGDAWAVLEPSQSSAGGGSSLRVRADIAKLAHRFVGSFYHRAGPGAAAVAEAQSSLLSTIRHLEDDVCGYVARNDLRERVKGFVREALYRLAYRDDVARIVVNSHSQGTVVAYDVLRELSYAAIPKVKWFVTCGSPLRKYADLFDWGTEAGCIKEVTGWTNFWDLKDPVADPLAPPRGWKRGTDPTVLDGSVGLYQALDPNAGRLLPITISDRQVDNLTNSTGGGLQAHNYWDNETEVVRPLSEVLTQVAAMPAPPVTRMVQMDSRQPAAGGGSAEPAAAEQPAKGG